mmetsp:Transcript_39612/g.77459  ORF Transcript_39612/g.77459 Transcript_39612/m.77459 type:complete len:92 (-) Transcript_39612:26-301(-)
MVLQSRSLQSNLLSSQPFLGDFYGDINCRKIHPFILNLCIGLKSLFSSAHESQYQSFKNMLSLPELIVNIESDREKSLIHNTAGLYGQYGV